MINFTKALRKKLLKSISNNFGLDNFDEIRFGEYSLLQTVPPKKKMKRIKKLIKDLIGFDEKDFIAKYGERLNRIYYSLNNNNDKELLLEIIAYRLKGFRKIKLSRNNKEYCAALELVNKLVNEDDTLNPNFLFFILKKFDLTTIGYDVKLYFMNLGVVIDFIFEQYAYKLDRKTVVSVDEGDVVLDLGACWGDTALYFASKTGNQGKVYSFEFIPNCWRTLFL